MSGKRLALKELPDRELVIAFKAGESGAYDEIFRRYGHRIMRICDRKLGDPNDAAEAAQETFLRAYQALPRFNGSYKLGAWLSRIATNVCIDEIRSRSRGASFVHLQPSHESLQQVGGPESIVGDSPRLDEALG